MLVHGSGPIDRDSTVFGHKPFLVLADYLSRQGIAVLRYDKRGVGKSTVSVHLAQHLAIHGYRVLLIDCDSQASASSWEEKGPPTRADVSLVQFHSSMPVSLRAVPGRRRH